MVKLIKDVNDLATTNPSLAMEWDYEKNDGLLPNMFSHGSHFKVWWKCSKGHSWQASIGSRASGRGCPICSGNVLQPGFNDFVTLYPDIAKLWDNDKNINLKPNEVFPKSKRKVWWKCDNGHFYEMSIDKKTARGFGCPLCSNYRIKTGFNDLATTHPHLCHEWNYDKNGLLTPQQIGRNNTKKVWWVCQKGHEWKATPHDRTQDNTGCPICAARRNTSFPEQAIYYYIKKIYPDAINRYKCIFDNGMELDVYIPSIHLAIEFDGRAFHNTDVQHKRELVKYSICKKNNIELIRIKEKHNQEWKDTADDVYFIPKEHNYRRLAYLIQHLLNVLDTRAHLEWALLDKPRENFYLPPQSSVTVNLERDRLEILSYLYDIDNSLAKLRPDIAEQWDYEKNKPLTPNMFSPGSNEKVWWICTNCGKSYYATINHKNRNDTRVCPECANQKRGRSFTMGVVAKVGSLRETNPELAIEFHPSKNGELTPDNITAGRFKYVWWKCSKCGYEWQQSPNTRKQGRGCPHCSGRVPMPGVDDLLTVNPELCKEWDYNKNSIHPSQVLPGSGKKVWWVRPDCEHEWQAVINSRKKHGCPKCNHKRKK